MALDSIKATVTGLATGLVVYFGDVVGVLAELTFGSVDLWVPFLAIVSSRITPILAPSWTGIVNKALLVASVGLAGLFLVRIIRRAES